MVARLIKGAAAAAKNRAKAAKNRAKAAADRAAKKAADAAKKAATSKPAIAAYGVTGGYQVGTASTLKSKTFSPRSRVLKLPVRLKLLLLKLPVRLKLLRKKLQKQRAVKQPEPADVLHLKPPRLFPVQLK